MAPLHPPLHRGELRPLPAPTGPYTPLRPLSLLLRHPCTSGAAAVVCVPPAVLARERVTVLTGISASFPASSPSPLFARNNSPCIPCLSRRTANGCTASQ
ncbi:hypothetical protein SLNWT_7295 [Streptomyces albus]|uniref:Uncharacterized protein n=1 Tax=Streptomyces albus (strain ATCC 21838 / DSM 41398 / FERM P-419 / JCM 4703 / NBRC 107858) TaxID=1081613 RepID=A0A0B5F9Y5_STRA4|nr:hypothetical protein SLNWT_7295 [Streptomyces albus]